MDASFLIAIQRGDAAAEKALAKLVDETIWIPAAAWVEYASGIAPPDPAGLLKELDAATVLEPFDRPQAEIAARIHWQLKRSGATMRWHDLQVAATALHLGEPLVTSDGDFQNVPGLRLIRF